jgi:hypothetical protein
MLTVLSLDVEWWIGSAVDGIISDLDDLVLVPGDWLAFSFEMLPHRIWSSEVSVTMVT